MNSKQRIPNEGTQMAIERARKGIDLEETNIEELIAEFEAMKLVISFLYKENK